MKKAILPLLALLLSAAVGTTRAAVVTLATNDDTKGSVMTSRRLQDTAPTAPVTVPELTVTDIAVTTALATWTACDGVTSYILQLASDNQFTTGGSSKTLTETFANATFSSGGGSYVDQNISGGDLGNWTATQCRGDKGAPVIRCGGTLTSPSFNGSVSKVEFDYEWPFSESGSCEIELYVNGTSQGTATVTGGTAGTATYTLKTPVDGPFTIELRNQATSNKRMQVTEVRIFTVASGSGSLIAEETITDGTSYTFTGLMPKTTYFARVKGNADWSNVVEFTTTWSELPAQTVTLSSNDDTKGSVMMSRRIQDTDLSVGSIIQAGDILSLTKYDLNMNEYRWRTDEILYPESKCVISKSNKEVIFGLDAVWTNPNHKKFYPVTEEKTDGNAWQMTRVNETSQRIYISGIQTDQVLLPAGVTLYADGSYNVENGTHLTVVAVAQKGCHIAGWSNGNNPITTGVSYYDYAYDSPQRCPAISVLDITVDRDMDLRVNFAKNTFNVTLATSDDTKGSVMTSRRFQDTDLSVGSIIQGGDILSLTNCDLLMEENRWRIGNSIQPALFVIEKTEGDVIFGVDAAWNNEYYPVTETMSDGNAWQVTQVYQDRAIYVAGIQTNQVLLPAGITRNDDGSYNVVNGTHLTVVAMTKAGCHVTGWSNGDTPIKEGVSNSNFAYTNPDKCPAVSELEITVNGDMNIRANFATNTFDVNFTALNANTIENGKAIVKVNGTPATLTDGTLKSVEPGSTISITPSEGYRVAAKSDGLDNLRAASQKDATVTINYVYRDDNSSTFVSNGDNTFTFVSGTGHGGGDAVIEKKLVVKDGLLVFSQKFAMADDRETFYFTFDPNEDTYSCAIPLQYIAGYHVNFTSIIVNGTDITSNLYGGKYKTGVTFKMPVEALNVSYELVRDLSVGTAINLYIDNELVTDDTRLIVKQDDTYGYVPTVPLTVSLTDEIEGVTLTPQQIVAAGITPVILLKVKYNWSPVASFNPLTNLPDDIEPGQTYSIRLKGTDGSAYYDQTPRTSAVTLFEGYRVNVPAGAYITYYMDEALYEDDDDLQLYTVTAVNDESVSLTAIPSANAEMPFLIYNGSDQPKTALLVPTKDEINQAVAPQFKGTLTAQEMPASSATTDYYVLSQNAFVWVKGSGTIPANKCWLEMDKGSNAPAKLRITETTGATGIAGISGLSAPSALYDLQGRKVLRPTLRGIYIQNGKKIVVK